MALALNPELLIADEPTTALDVTVQAQIIDLLKRLQAEFGIAVIMITHDLGVVANMAHEVIVMYAGQAAEVANRRATYYRPHHPYTVGLLGSLPQRGEEGARLRSIPGQPPSPINRPSGCAFHPRCDFAMPRCEREEPGLIDIGFDADHRSACFLPSTLLGTAAEADDERAKFAAAARERGAASSAGGLPNASR
jgi:oligopeptide/dipeptide ABC transporter ATP-binding protein